MPWHNKDSDGIIGEKIYCTFEKIISRGIISGDKKKDKGQRRTLKGNPATAVITKTLRRIK